MQASRFARAALIGASILVALGFALYTEQVWEDFLISLRHSVNLIEGRGLTYQDGERVQGFSSPLAVLIGAGAYALAGMDTDTAVWLFRIAGIAAHAAGLLYLLLACTVPEVGNRRVALITTGVVYALESKMLAFATNGMETPFFVMFGAGSLWVIARGLRGVEWLLGAFWGGLLWTRPDGAVYIALMGLAILMFPSDQTRSARLRSLVIAGLVCAAVYLPWFVFAWLYYGSPVPLPVYAKGAVAPGLASLDMAGTWSELRRLLPLVYLPPYAQYGGWSSFKGLYTIPCLAAAFYWLYPGGERLARQSSFAVFGGLIYLFLVRPYWPWYLPIVFLFSLPVWYSLMGAAEQRLARARPAARAAGLGGSLAVVACFAFLAVDYARLAHYTTVINEQTHRRVIGSWLGELADPHDSVFLECPGYIGFYSGLKMLDYPGVVAPEVVRFNRKNRPSMAAAAFELAPDWLVLRPQELRYLRKYDGDGLRRHYEPVKVFDHSKELAAALPDHPATLYDSTFVVLRRR